MWVTSSTSNLLTPTAIALGNFDGIHLGHKQVLQPILRLTSDNPALYPTVVTFTPHPQEFFTGETRQLLTPVSEKIQRLEPLGIQQLVRLPFDRELAALSPQAFVSDILIKQLQVKQISVGEDFRFGHKRSGTAEDLRKIAANYGVSVHVTALVEDKRGRGGEGERGGTLSSLRISSSLIRQCLADGNIKQANQMLGYCYSLIGKVIQGQQLGRTIGFPTANLEISPDKLLPRFGVYCVQIKRETGEIRQGVMNIGYRPTVEGQTPTVEVHLFDWSEDLYQQTLTVELVEFLRPEQKFSSLDALKDQISQDCQLAKEIFDQSP
ncbi:riboflavin biosynthesis protein RibF [Rippkaea orientalis PCC 8801]|uniref:Riboflavin biosynthesis protein n=1 Tax=Rippkaea orientalis (strain PCC 8801 / RF-1) TaxID=41431 RepID=B7JZ34_RIPO1|nr:bifunctional riboflavin kinase/FAD synthetase [Rippkaea orientalis]ACK66111.1 riboflavin biosynthesis protein RibF [Rippkaea orientalis PCC 8801]